MYPFVEGATELGSVGSNNHPLLRYLIKDTTPQADTHRRQLSEVFQCLSAVLPKINNLVNAETISMSDSIIIQVVFIAIGPFFIVEPGEGDAKGKKDNTVVRTFGKSAMRGLRLDALSLIRSVRTFTSAYGGFEDANGLIDLRQPRKPKILDYRGDSVISNQTF